MALIRSIPSSQFSSLANRLVADPNAVLHEQFGRQHVRARARSQEFPLRRQPECGENLAGLARAIWALPRRDVGEARDPLPVKGH